MKISDIHIGYDKSNVATSGIRKAYEETESIEITGIRLILFWLVFIINILLILIFIGFILFNLYLLIAKPDGSKEIIADMFSLLSDGTLISLLATKINSLDNSFWILLISFYFIFTYFEWIKGIINLYDGNFNISKNHFEDFLLKLIALFILTTPLNFEAIFMDFLIVVTYFYTLEPIINKKYWKKDKRYLSEEEIKKRFSN